MQISDGRPAVLTVLFTVFRCFEASAGIAREMGPQKLPTSVFNSLSILPFDVM